MVILDWRVDVELSDMTRRGLKHLPRLGAPLLILRTAQLVPDIQKGGCINQNFTLSQHWAIYEDTVVSKVARIGFCFGCTNWSPYHARGKQAQCLTIAS